MVNAKPNVLDHRRYVQEKLSTQIQRLLDVELPTYKGNTVREELSSANQKTVDRFYAVIERLTKENEKISAEVIKIIAEAGKLFAGTRKLNLESDNLATLCFATT